MPQPSYELTLHPIDMTRHGLNPYGESVYRVVWADSRKTKVYAHGKMHVLPRYLHGVEGDAAGHWVLEKWAPAEVIVGLTREQYEAMLATMPYAAAEEYPVRGDWELSAILNEESGPFAKHVDEIALHRQLAMHEAVSARKTMFDREMELAEQEAVKTQAKDAKFEEIYEAAREESLCRN